MTIKKPSLQEITIDSNSNTVKVQFNNSINVSIGEAFVEKPGEYEISNINLEALEVPEPDYKGVIDFLSVSSEGIDVGLVFSEKGTNKDALKDIANIDVLLISSDITTEGIKRLQSFFEPQYLVLFGSKNLETLQKELSLPTLVEDKSLKIKDSDFPRGENIILRPLLLK